MSGAAGRSITRPVVMRDPNETHRASTWLELLFDLCFVVAVSSLAGTLHDDPTIGGAVRFAGLFVPVWWAWMGYTWFASAWDNDEVLYRIGWFGAMLGVLWLAAAIPAVVTGASTQFVLAYVALRLVLVGLFARIRGGAPDEVRPFVHRYILGGMAGAAIWTASLLLPAPARYAVWAIGLAVEIGTPLWAVATFRGRPYVPRVFHPGHIRERYGLFTLIVLGESILAVAAGTADIDWQPAGVATGVLGFVLAASIWWIYFDRHDDEALRLGSNEAFQWGYGHLLVYAGIAAVGVGIELAIVAAGVDGAGARVAGSAEVGSSTALDAGINGANPYDLSGRMVLGAGLGTVLAALAFIRWTAARRLAEPVVAGRLAGAALVVAGAVVAPPPVLHVGLTTAVVVALIVTGWRRAEAPASSG